MLCPGGGMETVKDIFAFIGIMTTIVAIILIYVWRQIDKWEKK